MKITLQILMLFTGLFNYSCQGAEQQDLVPMTNYVGKTYQEMYKELGTPVDKMGYTIEHAPTNRWNHTELFSKYPKNEKNKDIQIMEAFWTVGDFDIYACYHMVEGRNECLVAKRLKKNKKSSTEQSLGALPHDPAGRSDAQG